MAPLMAAVRWIARIAGALWVAVFASFLFGEGFGPRGVYTLNPLVLKPEELIAVSLNVAVCAGLLAAWRWEGWGGGIAVSCASIFATLRSFRPHGFPLWAILAMIVPGLLFLLCWALTAPRFEHRRV